MIDVNQRAVGCFVLVTGLDLWGVLVATGAVCIIYCTLVCFCMQQ